MSARSHQAEADFRRRMDEAKARKNLSDVVGRRTKLKRRGRGELVGLCPFHDEKTPSLEVNDAKGVFHCHGCGASGDHFTFLTKADGLSFREAFEALSGDRFPTVDPAERAKQRAEDAALRQAAICDARWMWDQCEPVAGTIGATYLRDVRGITMHLPAAGEPVGNQLPTGGEKCRQMEDGGWRSSSVADATGAAPPILDDPSKVLFDAGVALLTKTGLKPQQARGLIAKWRKARGEPWTREALISAEGKAEPVSWIEARAKASVAVEDEAAAVSRATAERYRRMAMPGPPAGAMLAGAAA